MAIFHFDNIKISGMACAIPKNVIRPDDFKELFGEEEVEKFKQMTGVVESRRTDLHQTAGDLCYTAAEYLLKEKGVDKSEIGALVMSTQSPDYRRPSTSFIIHKRMGLSEEAAVFDINLGCSSVLYGIQALASIMVTSDIKKAILVSGDTSSKITNPNDKSKIMLGGEAGVALLLEKTEEESKIVSMVRSNGEGYRYLITPAGGFRNMNPPREEVVCKDGIKRTLYDPFMMGTSVFTFTVFDVPKVMKDFFKETGTNVDDYDCFAFHQANLYILKQIAKKMKIPAEKMPLTLPTYGNTSGASPIVTLCDTYGKNTENKDIKVLLSAFGIGLSWGVTSFHINTADILPVIEDDTWFEEGLINSPAEL